MCRESKERERDRRRKNNSEESVSMEEEGVTVSLVLRSKYHTDSYPIVCIKKSCCA